MSDPAEPTFGELLQRFRNEAGLTQEALAALARVSLPAISALERGVRRRPYANTVARLATALDLAPGDRAHLERAARRQVAERRSRAPACAATADRRPTAGSGGEPALIGRAREWAWLEGEIRAGHPLILLGGEPGIGKTRLLREAAGWARRHGWRVLWGGCQRTSRQEPYAPIVEAMERSIRALPEAARRAALRDYAWLGCLLPEHVDPAALAALLRTARPEHEQRLLFAAVERYLSGLAGRSGTLLVLDDLQWVGPDALQLTARLLRGSAAHRIRVLGAYRSNEVAPGHPLSALVADLARDDLVARLELATLGWADATALARALLPAPPRDAGGGDEAGRVVARLVARTGGVPYFLVSYARWLQSPDQGPRRAEPGSAAEDAGQQQADAAPTRVGMIEELPLDVAHSIRERVAALPEVAQELLAVAAVVGKPASGKFLAAAAERTEAEALPALEAACRAGLLAELPEADGPGRVRCAHDLVGEVVEADLRAWRRTQLHRQVAHAFELVDAGEAGRAPDRPSTQLAYHYARAGMPEKAAVYLRLAGDQARRKYAHRDAAESYRELTAVLDRLGRGREAAQARTDLAVELARVGRLGEALALLEQAERIYRAAGDVEAIAVVTMAIGQVHAARGMIHEGLARVQTLVRDLAGAAAAPSLPTALGADLHGALAGVAFMAGQYDDALQAATRAVEAAEAAGDEALLARQRVPLGVAFLTFGRTAEAADSLRRAIAGAEAAGDQPTLADALRMASWTYQTRGEFAESRVVQDRALAVASQLGDRVGLGHTVFLGALLDFYTGDWGRARAIGESASAIFQANERLLLSSYPPLGLGWLDLVQGRTESAERHLAEAREIAEANGGLQVLRLIEALLAERDLLTGRPDAARARLEPLLGRGLLQERTRVEFVVLLAWAAVQMGPEDQAKRWVRDGVESARGHEINLVLPAALRVQALWAMRRRRWREAERALEESLARCRAMPSPYDEAKALYVHGRLAVARDEPACARDRFTAALAILARLGERLYAEHIERELAVLDR